MAKYDITYKCGHEGRIELFGKSSDRDRKIAQEEKSVCNECYAKQQAEENNMEIVEMHYSEYKNNYSKNKTVKDSYDKATKTIKVYVVKTEEIEETALTEIEEAIETAKAKITEENKEEKIIETIEQIVILSESAFASQKHRDDLKELMSNTAKVVAKTYSKLTIDQLKHHLTIIMAAPAVMEGEKQMHTHIINFLLEVR